MANAVMQGTVSWLVAQLNKLQAGLEQERARISMNNAAIMAIDKRADTIADPAKRQRAKARIATFVAQQVKIARNFRTWGGKFIQLYTQGKQWLAANGLLNNAGLSGRGLFGLDAAPLVPVLIAGAVVASIAAYEWIRSANTAQDKARPIAEKLVEAFIRGEISEQQFDAGMEQVNKFVDAAGGKDPFGLESLTTPLLIVGGIVVLVIFGPQIARALEGHRAQGRAA